MAGVFMDESAMSQLPHLDHCNNGIDNGMLITGSNFLLFAALLVVAVTGIGMDAIFCRSRAPVRMLVGAGAEAITYGCGGTRVAHRAHARMGVNLSRDFSINQLGAHLALAREKGIGGAR